MTKRRVLIPLDGSEFSRQIVRVVRTFFDPDDVQLNLFRVATPPTATPDVRPHDVFAGAMPVGGSYDAYSRAMDEEFESATKEREICRSELLEEMREDTERLRKAGYTVSSEVHFGEPSQRIIECVKENEIDLVAMTTHGRTGLGRLVLGSVAERVLRGVSVPVLLMRSASESVAQRSPGEELAASLGSGQRLHIAAATDGSTLAQRAVSKASDMAKMLDARLTLLVAASERDDVAHSQQVMESACQLVSDLDPRPEAVPLVGYADDVLLRYLAETPADLLVIGAFQDRGAGSTTAIGPTAQRLVQHAPTSVLIHKGHRSEFRRILACVAVDDDVVVDVAAQLARAAGAELSLLHVIPPTAASYLSSARGDTEQPSRIPLEEVLSQGTHLSAVLTKWIGKLEEYGNSQDVVLVERGSVPEAILKVAHDGSYDLIVAGSRSGPGYFLGSVANGLVRYAEQSVLVLRTRGA